jgi:hypothetical protein
MVVLHFSTFEYFHAPYCDVHAVGPQKSTEEGRCIATGSHATIEGTAVFLCGPFRYNNKAAFSMGSIPRLI